MRFLLLILKNLSRNVLRSLLTALAVVCLVALFSMIATVLRFLDRAEQIDVLNDVSLEVN